MEKDWKINNLINFISESMNEFYENIKNKTTCTECGNKEMDISYVYEGGGAVKKQTTVMNFTGYQGMGNLLLITCKGCGFVAKTFLIGR